MFYNCKVIFNGMHYTAFKFRKAKVKRSQAREIEYVYRYGDIIDEETGEVTQGFTDQLTTLRKEFDRFYNENIFLDKEERKKALIKCMEPYFENYNNLLRYVDDNLRRKHKAYIFRLMRFKRKAMMNRFNYFTTFTYDDKLCSEGQFKKRLRKTLQNFATRCGWKYMGVWERGDRTDRLHFHCLIYVPDGTMPGEIEVKEVYDFKSHKRKEVHENSYFRKRFGVNDFTDVGHNMELDRSVKYIVKYMEKTFDRVVYSRGLPDSFRGDIPEDDVLFEYGEKNERLFLHAGTHIYREDEDLGTLAQFRERMIRYHCII